jgi:hypothetical protein
MIHIGIFNNKKIDNEPTRKIMAKQLDGENSINANTCSKNFRERSLNLLSSQTSLASIKYQIQFFSVHHIFIAACLQSTAPPLYDRGNAREQLHKLKCFFGYKMLIHKLIM